MNVNNIPIGITYQLMCEKILDTNEQINSNLRTSEFYFANIERVFHAEHAKNRRVRKERNKDYKYTLRTLRELFS
jgi:hypothetical protein